MSYDLTLYPNPILAVSATKVNINALVTNKFRDMVSSMFETMYRSGGVGLAATQVGIDARILVGNPKGRDFHLSSSFVLVNPEIIDKSGEQTDIEGCLSLPGIYAPVTRYDYIKVETIDLGGQPKTIEASGFTSRIIQHEIDHLNGIVFIDRLSPQNRDLISHRLLEHVEEVKRIRDERTAQYKAMKEQIKKWRSKKG